MASGQARFVLEASPPTVDIRDVADAAVLAENYGRAGERYIIANEYISNRDFYAIATGKKPPRVIPKAVAYPIAWTAEAIFKLMGKKHYLLSTDAVYLSDAFGEMDITKARKELYWNPRPVKETVEDAVAWFASRALSPSSP